MRTSQISMRLLLIGIVILATIILYTVFDMNLTRMSEESLKGWIKAETISIQQGQLLPTFAKNQALLSSSEMIKGVYLINLETSRPYIEIQFGNNLPNETLDKVLRNKGNFTTTNLGFFHKAVSAEISGSQKFLVIFETRSQYFEQLFIWTSLIFLLLFAFMTLILRRIEKRQLDYAHLASKVAHDIRSPINTLNHLALSKKLDSEVTQELLKKTIERLQTIVKDLVERRQEGFSSHIPVTSSLSSIANIQSESWKDQIQSLVQEKQATVSQWPDVIISYSNNSLNSIECNVSELCRSLSNVIDNSIEAIGFSGKIHIAVTDADNKIEFIVSDDGRGVPTEILSEIGKPNFSFGKSNGSGMGVHLAKQFFETNHGSFVFQSKPGEGSTVKMTLPSLSINCDYVVLDDDPLAHDIWKMQIRETFPHISEKFLFFKTIDELISLNPKITEGIQYYFIDYDLKSKLNGLEVIEALDIQKRSVLVTHSFDDTKVSKEAKWLGVTVFSKSDISALLKSYIK